MIFGDSRYQLTGFRDSGIEIRHFSLRWPLAYTTVCATVAVIYSKPKKLTKRKRCYFVKLYFYQVPKDKNRERLLIYASEYDLHYNDNTIYDNA